MKNILHIILVIGGVQAASASDFVLSSSDIQSGVHMQKTQEFMGFGCVGDNLSPQLSWQNPPKGTKSFAITAYDPDAPTGSGWWHWQVINIPTSTTEFKQGAGDINTKNAPRAALQIENDYGFQGFGGACPPKGDKVHHYQFTVYALSIEHIDVKANASGALIGYMIKANTLDSSTIEALYKR